MGEYLHRLAEGQLEMRPIIGITLSSDGGEADSLLPGRSLYYANRDYALAVEKAEAVPLFLPIVRDHQTLGEILSFIDGLLISGGGRPLPDEILREPQLPTLRKQNPERYDHDALLIAEALKRQMPVLGICRGAQMLNEVTGGTMYLRLSPWVEESAEHLQTLPGNQPCHRIRLEPGSKLAAIMGVQELWVNSFHVQAIKECGQGFAIVARAEDRVVEAIEATVHPFAIGVQFHPEKMIDQTPFQALFAAFRVAAGEYATRKAGSGSPGAWSRTQIPGSGVAIKPRESTHTSQRKQGGER